MSSLHSHDHNDHHDHHHGNISNQRVLLISFCIITGYMLIEVIGGILTGSLALLSDAGHMFSDSLSLGLALAAFKLGERAISSKNTFGYKRAEIIAAMFNGITLIAIAFFIIFEAIQRFRNPSEIASVGMLIVSSLGLLVNIVVAWLMYRYSDVEENVNMKGAYLHVFGDLLGSLGAIGAALLIIFFGWNWADPVASILVALIIANSGRSVLKSTLHILMEGSPANIDQNNVVELIMQTDGVKGVHDLHLWTLTSNQNLMSVHIMVDGNLSVTEAGNIVLKIEQKLYDLNIHHVTIQVESESHQGCRSLYCVGREHSVH